jgi:hypothetical protein
MPHTTTDPITCFLDTYRRAEKLCEQFDCYGKDSSLEHGFGLITLSSGMQGILRGSSAVESAKR